MKISKKLIALLLVVVMLSSTLCASVNAIDWGGHTPYVPVDDDVLPTIIVPGLFQSETKYYVDGKEAINADGEPYAMPFFMDTTTEIVGAAVTEALVPIAELLINQEDKDAMAAKAVANVLCETLMGKQKLDETGHFINDIRATEYNDSFYDPIMTRKLFLTISRWNTTSSTQVQINSMFSLTLHLTI